MRSWTQGCLPLLLYSLACVPSLSAQEVRGLVRDGNTGVPLAQVLVRVVPTGAVTLTDRSGLFFFQLQKGEFTLTFQAMGFESTQLRLNVPVQEPLEVLLAPRPVELEGIEAWGHLPQRGVPKVQTDLDFRIARLPGSSRVLSPDKIRQYDDIHPQDPWKLLAREFRATWDLDPEVLRYRGLVITPWRREKPEVYIDDRRTWLLNYVLTPNAQICRIEIYEPPPWYFDRKGPARMAEVPFQLRAYTCLFMADIAEGKREMRRSINWGDLIAGPGG